MIRIKELLQKLPWSVIIFGEWVLILIFLWINIQTLPSVIWLSNAIVVTGFFTLMGGVFGTISTGLINYFSTVAQDESENRRTQQLIEAEREKISLQVKRATYADALSVVTRGLAAAIDEKDFPDCYGEEYVHNYHATLNAFLLVASDELDTLRKSFFTAYPRDVIQDPEMKKTKIEELRAIVLQMRIQMRKELGLVRQEL